MPNQKNEKGFSLTEAVLLILIAAALFILLLYSIGNYFQDKERRDALSSLSEELVVPSVTQTEMGDAETTHTYSHVVRRSGGTNPEVKKLC